MLDAFTGYTNNGFAMTIGVFPEHGTTSPIGREQRAFMGKRFDVRDTRKFGTMPEMMKPIGNAQQNSMGTKFGSSLGIGMSALMVGMGAADNGAWGAYDALMTEVAVNSAVMKQAYIRAPRANLGLTAASMGGGMGSSKTPFKPTGPTQTVSQRSWWGNKTGGTPLGRGVGMMGMTMGAYIGAGIGGEAMGTLGSFAGAAVGARVMRNPLTALLGAGTLIGATQVGKGAYQVLKSGYRKAQSMKGFDLAGDTASFLTRNAVTMRSRSMEAIHRSHLNARSALGQEATYMHMNRDSFSMYRRVGNMM